MALSFGTVTFGLVGAAAITLAIIGSPEERKRRQMEEARAEAPPVAQATATAPVALAPAMASVAGVTLTSVSLTLPTSDRNYPTGPHVDVINNNCLACHSAGMVLTQPQLSRAEWQGEVTKMVNVYKAPVSPQDAGALVDYLAQLRPGR